MIRVNDVVLYGIDGICHVTGTCTRMVAGKRQDYYVLKPVFMENYTLYVPADNPALVERMHRLLSLNEVLALIRSIPDEETLWIEDNARRRAEYDGILEGGDRRAIMRLIKTLHERDKQMKQNHRKLPSADERLMKDAEKRLYDEFALVLNIEPQQVLPFIFQMIEEKAGA